MAFIPFAATVGGWMGASAAVGGATIAATAATAAVIGTTMTQAAAAEKKVGKVQEQAMQQQATGQVETQRQIEAMGAESKAAIEELKKATVSPTPIAEKAVEATTEAARKEELKKRVRRTKTLLTGPQGVLGAAEIGRKVLLGA